ncbi:hypothetical protein MHBO_002724 [Bonamia ostreae]|uniref:Mitochondrial import inner membrane translocase subunit n=1 Tax=Bonamia ostreae TaxID=126728 RepID=A0ABV2ANW0_9EUKA
MNKSLNLKLITVDERCRTVMDEFETCWNICMYPKPVELDSTLSYEQRECFRNCSSNLNETLKVIAGSYR